MATLYELTGDYLQLMEMLYDDEADPQAVADTMEGIGGEIEDKADGYAKIIRQLTADADTLKTEIARMTERKKALEEKAEKLKSTLKVAMETTGKTKFKTACFSFSIANNPVAVVLDDPKRVPWQYLTPQEPKIDKTAIKKAMEAGADFEGIAHMERTTRLSIK